MIRAVYDQQTNPVKLVVQTCKLAQLCDPYDAVGKIKAGRIEQYSKGLIEHRTADERKIIMKLVIQIEKQNYGKAYKLRKIIKIS